jgi:multicomponent Na+:H+ antiporter subunit G
MTEYGTAFLMISGSLFCLVAALGVCRLPDALIRMHAVTKAGTLGAGLMVLGHAVFFQMPGIFLRAVFIIGLLLLTAPVAAHLIARASYRSGVSLSGHTWIDELKEKKKM